LPWTAAEQTQAIDRVHRVGQRNTVTAWRPLVLDSMDADVAARIDARARWAETAIDGAAVTDAGLWGATTWALATTLARAVGVEVPEPSVVDEPIGPVVDPPEEGLGWDGGEAIGL